MRRSLPRLGPLRWPRWVTYEPRVLTPYALMRSEGIEVLEEWFRWSEEWSMLLRVFGRVTERSKVVEIGCGSGRIAFPLRFILREGSYDGFDIRRAPIVFLQRKFQPVYPNFRFHFADVHNTFYNSKGVLKTTEYAIPVGDGSTDLVFAASIFTHMLPENTRHYFAEAARVLRPGGRCVFSFFLLDHYRPGAPRRRGFAAADFNFDYQHGAYGEDFAIADPADPERMTSYRLELIRRFADAAGLELNGEPVPGLWSGSFDHAIAAQDLIVLRRPAA